MLRAVLFDMGGTLDGDGEHWLDRFARVYAEAGVTLPREVIRKGFDHAERRAAAEADSVSAGLDVFVRLHVTWQSEVHGRTDAALLDSVVQRFVSDVRSAAQRNVPILAELHRRGLRLGVVSNACGNVQVLCDEFGFSPFLDCVIDSHHVGIAKPDPAIFRLALDSLVATASSTMMVGDSYERDILPARALGMRAVWLAPADRAPGSPSPAGHSVVRSADAVIQTLSDLLPLVANQEQVSA